jgi:hypothetical protein
MKLISESEYDKYIANRRHLPSELKERDFFDTDKKASYVIALNQIPDDIKLALYNSLMKGTLEKLLELKREKAQPSIKHQQDVKPESDKSQTDDNVIETNDSELLENLPRSHQLAGEKILQYLKKTPGLISWDESGACKFYEKFEPQSNIVDLLAYVLNTNKKLREPFGLGRFLYILKLLNIPTSILGYKIRSHYEKSSLERLRRKQRDSISRRDEPSEVETNDDNVLYPTPPEEPRPKKKRVHTTSLHTDLNHSTANKPWTSWVPYLNKS